jgi:hypothetical protein
VFEEMILIVHRLNNGEVSKYDPLWLLGTSDFVSARLCERDATSSGCLKRSLPTSAAWTALTSAVSSAESATSRL